MFVLMTSGPWADCSLHGVYSTRDKAREAAASIKRRPGEYIVIHGVDVDAPPRFRGSEEDE